MSQRQEALARLRRYVEMREVKPLKGIGDSIHGIHIGTEWEADLTLSDLRLVVAPDAGLAAAALAVTEDASPNSDGALRLGGDATVKAELILALRQAL